MIIATPKNGSNLGRDCIWCYSKSISCIDTRLPPQLWMRVSFFASNCAVSLWWTSQKTAAGQDITAALPGFRLSL